MFWETIDNSIPQMFMALCLCLLKLLKFEIQKIGKPADHRPCPYQLIIMIIFLWNTRGCHGIVGWSDLPTNWRISIRILSWQVRDSLEGHENHIRMWFSWIYQWYVFLVKNWIWAVKKNWTSGDLMIQNGDFRYWISWILAFYELQIRELTIQNVDLSRKYKKCIIYLGHFGYGLSTKFRGDTTNITLGLPSGKRLHNYGKIHHAITG